MSRLNIALSIAKDELAWFEDSPAAGDPECICSYCGFAISRDQVPTRIHSLYEKTEARLCENCLDVLHLQVKRHVVLFWN